MSFSSDVKEELVKVLPGEAHCRMAELAALLTLYGKVEYSPKTRLLLSTDNNFALRKCFTLLSKTFNIKTDSFQKDMEKPKNLIELNDENAEISVVLKKLNLSDPMALLKKECCMRAYLRGAFLASGFVNDPNKGYHFELVSDDTEYTKLLTYLISHFNICPKHSVRKKKSVIYVKESEAVSDILSVLGAYISMMDLANTRIVREVRNGVNRRNNCDTANITKAVNAASKQIEDIELIQKVVGLDSLPDTLREMAYVRMENPDSSFSELGGLLDPPVGKSGVNHRLRKLSEYAEDLRREREKT